MRPDALAVQLQEEDQAMRRIVTWSAPLVLVAGARYGCAAKNRGKDERRPDGGPRGLHRPHGDARVQRGTEPAARGVGAPLPDRERHGHRPDPLDRDGRARRGEHRARQAAPRDGAPDGESYRLRRGEKIEPGDGRGRATAGRLRAGTEATRAAAPSWPPPSPMPVTRA